MKSVIIISLGCDKNTVDAERMAYRLERAGFRLVETLSDADCAVINTCGFIENAKKEAIEAIFTAVRAKERGGLTCVVVTGCLAQRYADELKTEIPELDAVVTLGKSEDIAAIVAGALDGQKTFCAPQPPAAPLEGGRLVSTPSHYAYLKIADGCDNRCTFCAIPNIRGGYVSREPENVLKEAGWLAENGVKELILIAQDTTKFGRDGYDICDLISDIEKIDGFRWIRLLYAYPDGLTDKLISLFATSEKLLPYIDIPLQHCSSAVLRRMGRRITDKAVIQGLLHKLKSAAPDIAVRTTFIAGFPAETDEQFAELCDFAKTNGFARAGCFAFSCEEGTPAAKLDGQLDEDVKNKRADALNLLLYEALLSRQSAAVGSVIEAICDGEDTERAELIFRSRYDAPDVDTVIFVAADDSVRAGDIRKIRIVGTDGADLLGVLDN